MLLVLLRCLKRSVVIVVTIASSIIGTDIIIVFVAAVVQSEGAVVAFPRRVAQI